MHRRAPLLVALLLALALPGAARAADPLLSGYAGPGSGEQVILGGTTVGGGGGGGGGGAAGGAAAAANKSLRATAPASSSTSSAGNANGHGHGKALASHRPGTGSTAPGATSLAPHPAGAPPVVAYPARAGEVSGLPLSIGDALLGLLGLLLLVLLGLGLRRLSSGPQEPPSMPQVPVH